ncbi:hypothetical protein HSBAA_30740 [Vreelandella sulfidaeris]|uniref:Uncharacterized protein n=1 Tax=Vreelandella sulfidaeris TaxID=115553 RepID=A0A455UBU8_9GAMM|nr:hypothetical protein HSBAA_30740 [Halomonas sulfidaeris]
MAYVLCPEKHLELVKKDKRLYGAIVTLDTGQKVYMAYRKRSEIYRAGEVRVGEAIKKGVAAWAMDDDTLSMMRAHGITVVGVFVRDTGDRYVTKIDNYFDKTKIRILNYSARGGRFSDFCPFNISNIVEL